ncbi:MAG: hypothetical protein R3C30_16585 [Hyphomonadaceae bacterium]
MEGSMWRLALVLAVGLGACAAQAQVAAPTTETLNGAWVVDLSTEPGAPYTQPMELTLNADGTVSGSFYQSEIEAGRWKTDRGRTCVSFRTSDGAGPYHTAACLVDDHVEGQTWAEHRNFLFNWNAAR